MCIIIYKPAGEELPDKSLLEMCEFQNSHGAGIAVWNSETKLWDVNKGFMGWNEIEAEYDALNLNRDSLFLMHFRYATSGKKDGGNTHPFPITDDLEAMRQEKFSASCIAMHNGVVGSGEGDYSDSQVWIKEMVYPMMNYMDRDELWPIFGFALKEDRNRWIITKDDDIYFFGTWIKEHGIWWSNDYFKCDRTYKTTSPDYYNEKDGKYDIQGWKKKKKTYYSNTRTVVNNNGYYDYTKSWATGKPAENKTPAINQNTNWGKQTEPISVKMSARLQISTAGDLNEGDYKWLLEGLKSYEVLVTDGGDIVFQDDAEPGQAQKQFDNTLCPGCSGGNDKTIVESPFIGGDAYCTNCGCIFESGTGEINAFDPDYAIYAAS